MHDLREAMDAEYRRQLLRMNRERIEVAYLKARTQGVNDALIVVLNLQDDRAAGLAQATGLPWAQVEQAREACARDRTQRTIPIPPTSSTPSHPATPRPVR